MNKIKKIKNLEFTNSLANNLNSVMADAFGDDVAVDIESPLSNNDSSTSKTEVDFMPHIRRAVTIEEDGAGFSVTTSHKMYFEEGEEPFVKNSIYYYEKSADAVSMAKAFFSSHRINMTKDRTRVAKKLASEQIYKQLSFVDLL